MTTGAQTNHVGNILLFSRDVVVAYWARLTALQKGLEIDKSSPDALAILLPLMEWLEGQKKVGGTICAEIGEMNYFWRCTKRMMPWWTRLLHPPTLRTTPWSSSCMQTSPTEQETSQKVLSSRSTALVFSLMLCSALERLRLRFVPTFVTITIISLTGCTLQKVCKNEGCVYSQLSQKWRGGQFSNMSKAKAILFRPPFLAP